MKFKDYLREKENAQLEKVTKSKFKSIHKNKELMLIQAVGKSAEEILEIAKKMGEQKVEKMVKSAKPTSRIDVGSQSSSGYSDDVFMFSLYGYTFYVVQTTMDNSKNRETSRDDVVIDSVFYVKK